jgi:hypothetical protein
MAPPQVGGSSVHFSTDSTHVSRLPRHLRDPDEQLSLFSEQLAPHAPAAAAACLAARSDAGAGASAGDGAASWGTAAAAGDGARYAVDLSARFTFVLPEPRLLLSRQRQDDLTPTSEASVGGWRGRVRGSDALLSGFRGQGKSAYVCCLGRSCGLGAFMAAASNVRLDASSPAAGARRCRLPPLGRRLDKGVRQRASEAF